MNTPDWIGSDRIIKPLLAHHQQQQRHLAEKRRAAAAEQLQRGQVSQVDADDVAGDDQRHLRVPDVAGIH